MTTKIEWTDETWNPITGCTPISEGCQNCYAKRMAKRLKGRYGYPDIGPFDVVYHKNRLTRSLSWKKPRRIFVCSMGDLFHMDVRTNWIYDIFYLMAHLPQHTFIILTKRPERMSYFISKVLDKDEWPLKNVWLGVTAENQKRADERIPFLLKIPAAVRFVSIEPILSFIDLTIYEVNKGKESNFLRNLDWVICGGETGPGARPMKIEWARSLRDQCRLAGVPFFFKKVGSKQETPNDLKIREWPE